MLDNIIDGCIRYEVRKLSKKEELYNYHHTYKRVNDGRR